MVETHNDKLNVPFSQRLGVTHMKRSGMTFRRVVPVDRTGVGNTIVLSGRDADRRLTAVEQAPQRGSI